MDLSEVFLVHGPVRYSSDKNQTILDMYANTRALTWGRRYRRKCNVFAKSVVPIPVEKLTPLSKIATSKNLGLSIIFECQLTTVHNQ